MLVVFKGSISTVLASDPIEAKELDDRLGKRTENYIYYRRIGDLIRSVLVPEALSDQAEALSLHCVLPQGLEVRRNDGGVSPAGGGLGA